jgi:hypothetical protein
VINIINKINKVKHEKGGDIWINGLPKQTKKPNRSSLSKPGKILVHSVHKVNY